MSPTCIIDTKRTNEDFQVMLQTTPARCAAHPLLISGGESEKRPISSGLKGSIVRKVAVDKTRSSLERNLVTINQKQDTWTSAVF